MKNLGSQTTYIWEICGYAGRDHALVTRGPRGSVSKAMSQAGNVQELYTCTPTLTSASPFRIVFLVPIVSLGSLLDSWGPRPAFFKNYVSLHSFILFLP